MNARGLLTLAVSTLALAFAAGCGSAAEGSVGTSTSALMGGNDDGPGGPGGGGGDDGPGGPGGSGAELGEEEFSCLRSSEGECVAQCGYSDTIIDGVCTYSGVDLPGDGVGADSSPNGGCATGYYFCWSNVQQRAVCTTRKCY
jgi:hypothetical protein